MDMNICIDFIYYTNSEFIYTLYKVLDFLKVKQKEARKLFDFIVLCIWMYSFQPKQVLWATHYKQSIGTNIDTTL